MTPEHKGLKFIGGSPYTVGDVVIVTRDSGKEMGKEMAGIVYDIEKSGRVFIDYSGVVSLLHENEPIKHCPDDIKDALELRLKQNAEELSENIQRYTEPIREALEEYNKLENPITYTVNSIKSFLRKYNKKVY